MREFILEIFYRFILEILSSIWFLIRPVFYLYLIWVSMKVVALYH